MADPLTDEDRAFFARLAGFDWTYSYSDDARVYNAGRQTGGELRALANADASGRRKKMHEAWHAFVFSGQAFGTEKPPRPKIEDFA